MLNNHHSNHCKRSFDVIEMDLLPNALLLSLPATTGLSVHVRKGWYRRRLGSLDFEFNSKKNFYSAHFLGTLEK